MTIPTILLATALLLPGCIPQEAASTPDAVVQGIVHDFARSQDPLIIWNALPTRYQDDLEGLLHAASTKVNKDIYRKGFAIAQKLTQVLKKQKQFFLGNSMIKPFVRQFGKRRVDREWDSTISLLETLVSSELANVDSLQDLDVGKFLKGTGASLMKASFDVVKIHDMDPMTYLRRVRFKLDSASENTAVLKVFFPDEKLQRVEFTRIDGKWLPSDLVKDWDLKIPAARKLVEEMPDPKDMVGNLQTRITLAGLDNFLTNVSKAKNQKGFDKLVAGLFKLFDFKPQAMPDLGPDLGPGPRTGQRK